MAPAAAPTAPQTASATGTFGAGKLCRTRARLDGTISAAPRACSARAATSSSTLGARPHRAEATVNTATDTRKHRRRPTRSAIRPAGTRAAANTIVYAFSTHDSEPRLTSGNERTRSGKATNRIVVSRKTAKTDRVVTASTTQGPAGTPAARRGPLFVSCTLVEF